MCLEILTTEPLYVMVSNGWVWVGKMCGLFSVRELGKAELKVFNVGFILGVC